MRDEDSLDQAGADQSLSLTDFLDHLTSSESELREIIFLLIQNREHQRDRELARLQVEADELMDRLRKNQFERLLESIACFKDIIAMQKKLIEQNDQQRDRGEDTEAGSP